VSHVFASHSNWQASASNNGAHKDKNKGAHKDKHKLTYFPVAQQLAGISFQQSLCRDCNFENSNLKGASFFDGDLTQVLFFVMNFLVLKSASSLPLLLLPR